MQRRLVASSSSFLGTICSGMTTAFTSTLLPQIHQYINSEMGSWLATAILFSRLLGIVIGSPLLQRYGRKPFLILLNIPWICGWICLSAAENFWIFLTGCSIVGFVAGFYGFTATIYLVEISEPQFRGIFMVISTTGFIFGILLQNLIGTLFQWQTALHVSALLPLFTFFTALCAPETPNWLILNNFPQRAKKNLFWLRNGKMEEEEFVELLSSSIEKTKWSNVSTWDRVCGKQFCHSFFVVSIVMASVVFAGFEVLTMYSVDMISNMSEEVNAQWTTILTNAFAVVSSIFCGFIIEKLPRRFIYFSSSLGVLGSLFAIWLGLMLHLPKMLLVTFLCMYQTAINLGMMTIPWLLAAEIFPDDTRDFGSGLGNVLFFLLTMITIKMNPFLLGFLGIKMVILIYACSLLPCIIILYYVMPETRGYTLLQIEKNLERLK